MQSLLTLSLTVGCCVRPRWIWHTLPCLLVQLALLVLALGTRRYFADKEQAQLKQPTPKHSLQQLARRRASCSRRGRLSSAVDTHP